MERDVKDIVIKRKGCKTDPNTYVEPFTCPDDCPIKSLAGRGYLTNEDLWNTSEITGGEVLIRGYTVHCMRLGPAFANERHRGYGELKIRKKRDKIS